MRASYDSEFDRLLDRARELLGAGDDALLVEANTAINQALTLRPDSVDGWLVMSSSTRSGGGSLRSDRWIRHAVV